MQVWNTREDSEDIKAVWSKEAEGCRGVTIWHWLNYRPRNTKFLSPHLPSFKCNGYTVSGPFLYSIIKSHCVIVLSAFVFAREMVSTNEPTTAFHNMSLIGFPSVQEYKLRPMAPRQRWWCWVAGGSKAPIAVTDSGKCDFESRHPV